MRIGLRSGLQISAVVLLAAVLRFTGLDWDEGHAFHPDERRIAFALEEISFRPLQLNPHFFAYGSFPLYVEKLWVSAAAELHPPWKSFSGRILAARLLSALIGVVMVISVNALGRRLGGPEVGLLAALLLALSVLAIQHSHFITVDLYQAALALLALERLVAFSQSGGRGRFFTAAAVIGIALATKVSSLPLALPLVLAAFLEPAARRTRACFALCLLGLLVSAACFVLGEPYALLDRGAFLHDVREQAAMVRQAGLMPYTIQYLGTQPYLDDLRQAFTWGMGPALGLAAALGTGAVLVRAARRPRREEILLLAFFLPYLIVTGVFPVKFMRYLLPLYPLWCLYAAQLLVRREEAPSGRARRALAPLVVGATAAYALAFTTIYLRPHVWVTASRWFYREVPEGATVLTPHWEEGFPVSVDGFGSGRYRILELPLYEADNERKIVLLAERLAQGDTLVFPSKRLYGAISNAPARFPETSRLLELLFAGDLGYRLERVFASRPRLAGIELDDDFADESFSVYDHPKTLIFSKVEKLSGAEIAARIRSRVPSTPITRAQMLGAGGAATAQPPFAAIESSWPGALLWSTVLALLAYCGGRFIGAVVPEIPPAAASGLGPAFGYLLFVSFSWLAVALGMAPFGRAIVILVAVALALAARSLPRVRADGGVFVLYASFLFFLAIRAGNPEIYWGEKPMDFSFLNAIYRSTALPPPEPWMAGKAINYPYLGHFGVAALGKLAGVSPGLAFNLGIATTAALTAAAAFGVGAYLTESSGGGWLAAILVTFAGNLSGPVELRSRGAIDFHYFWATSRVIGDTINEFPLWSFLFADLHAHVMALPLSLLFLGLVYAWFRGSASRPLLLSLATGLALGAVATTNTWSLPVYGGALVGLAILAAVSERKPSRLVFAAFTLAFSYLWFLPYWKHFIPPPRNWGLETQAAPLGGFLLIFGGFLFVVSTALAACSRRRGISPGVRLFFVAALVVCAEHSTRAVLALLSVATGIAALVEPVAAARFSLALACAATAFGGLADTVYLWDRMNTIFKLYLEMWLFLALASAFWLRRLGDFSTRWARRSVGAVLSVLALASGFTSVTDVIGTLRTQRVPGPRPTLDGAAYLEAHRPAEAMAIRWLNRNIAGTPTILEAQGPPYEEFSRVSMNTGLPTVLGWEYHLSQRAEPWAEIDQRKADVGAIYSSLDRADVVRLLGRYHVAIVYLGLMERREYSPLGLSKFDSWTDLFQPIYRNPKVVIYAVTPNFRWSEAATVVEEPRPAEAARPRAEKPLPRGQLRQPRGVAIDAEGNVWVADFGNNRVQVFDPKLAPLHAFGQRGEEPGEFNDPCGVAIGPDGSVYVADTWNHRVQVLDSDGHVLRQWTAGFYGPRGVAVGPDGSVYVADTGNGRIVKFTSDGRGLARFGEKGSGSGQFAEPMGVAAGTDGRIYVADAGNRRIVVLSPEGSPIASWPVPGWEPKVFREPYLAVLPDGRVAATDPAGDRLLFFDPDGRLVGERALAAGSNPSGIAVARDGRIIVAELKADRIEMVSPP